MINLAMRQEGVEIISVETDVHFSKEHLFAMRLLDDLTQSLGQKDRGCGYR